MRTLSYKDDLLTDKESYWSNKLSEDLIMSSFAQYNDPEAERRSLNTYTYQLPEDISLALSNISNKSDHGLYIILMCGVKYLLSLYTSTNDIAVGTPVIKTKSGVAFQDRHLIIRSEINSGMNFKEFLLNVKQDVSLANKNQQISRAELEKLLTANSINADSIRPRTIVQLENVNSMLTDYPENTDTIFQFYWNDKCLNCDIKYRGNTEHMIKSIAHQMHLFFREVTNNPNTKLNEIEILSINEKNIILNDFNETTQDFPHDISVVELFEAQVLKTPNDTALIFKNEKLTYRELNSKANKLAKQLLTYGIKENSVVGLMLDRSLELPIGALGILKAGAAYLPIDPSYPAERINFLLRNTKLNVLIKGSHNTEELPSSITSIDINSLLKEECSSKTEENLGIRVSPDSLMYVLYTSGSTGEPKGVMVKRNSFVNLLTWYTTEFNMDADENIMLIAPISFDTAHKNIFAPLIKGGCLHIYEPGIYDYNKMSDYINTHQISVINCTPSGFYPLIPYNEDSNFNRLISLNYVFLGGESINHKKIKPWFDSTNFQCEVINTYGPTECTDLASFYRIEKQDVMDSNVIPIGKPLNNTELYIVDAEMKLLPIGVTGELCIGGAGMALGYYNDKELTNKKFVNVPYARGKKVYRTGDLARWLPNGNIEFIGRKDNLTKIRGYRVEVSEIEKSLMLHKDLEEAIVMAIDDKSGTKALSAYFVAKNDIPSTELRLLLLERLPEFMIPSYFTQLEKMPLNQNGKIDRRALPTPDFNNKSNYVAPETKTEVKLANLWEEVLGVENIGLEENFFELGGHSLKAATIILKINQELQINLQISDLFKHPTIKELAALANNKQLAASSSISPSDKRDYYPVSSQQRRLYIIWELARNSVAYNLPSATILEGKLDRDRLSNAFQKLVSRHEALRTSFLFNENDLVQQIHPELRVDIEFDEIEAHKIENQLKRSIMPFNLEVAPLFRVKVLKLAENRHLLFTDAHHIVFDGISMDILMHDFIQFYNGNTINANHLQYRDYAVWQERYMETARYKNSEKYWIERFEDLHSVLELNTDYPRSVSQNSEGRKISFAFDPQLVSRLKEVTAKNGTTIYTLMLTALNVLFHKYTGQKDITIGSPSSGRFQPGLEKIVGMFVNTVVLRNFPEPDKTFKMLLEEVKECVIESIDYEDYPFELLVNKLGIHQNTGRNPLFDVMFSLENIENIIIQSEELEYRKFPLENSMTQFDISINALISMDAIDIEFNYATCLFSENTIQRMAEHFIKILSDITLNIETTIRDINILSKKEEFQLLEEFNDTSESFTNINGIQELFEKRARLHPSDIALIHDGISISYAELDLRSNQLSRFLRKKGVERNSIVAIIANASIETVVGLLGVVKAGGAYLPIDPSFPESRIEYLLKDSECMLIMTDQDDFLDSSKDYPALRLSAATYQEESGSKINCINRSDDLAYLIYTSGTTGQPKGVMIEHENIVNQLNALQDTFEFESGLHHMLLAKLTFDASIQHILLPLISGGSLYIPETSYILEPDKLWQYIVRNKIDIVDTVPSHLRILMKNMDKTHRLRYVILGGEVLPRNLYEELLKTVEVEQVVNLYGPTETTINATYHICNNTENHNIPIGRPLKNYKAYIVDKNLCPVPLGATGELCIAGKGVGRGYINHAPMTKEKFISNPFSQDSNERMYQTGDLARWLPDGNIEYMGRADYQVKIKGIRVEPDEIKDHIMSHPVVDDAVVLAKQSQDGDDYLCVYLIANRNITSTELRDHLKDKLPEYMIPSYFVRLSKMPLTTNDKLDIKSLRERVDVEFLTSGIEYQAPTTDIENTIAKIWERVLGVSKVGIHDHFFEIGGNSLSIVQVNEQLKKELNIEINLVTLFRFTTIYSLAKELKIQNEAEKNIEQETIDRGQIIQKSKNRLMERRRKMRE